MTYLQFIDKKRLFYLFIMGLLCLLSSFVIKEEEHIVKNEFYSVYVPKGWEPYQHSNGYTPKERSCGPYKLYYLTWMTPIRQPEDIPCFIMLSIDTYKRNDGNILCIEELEDFEKGYISKSKILSYNEKMISPNKKKVVIKRSTVENGVVIEYCETYLYVKSSGVVHSMKILTRASKYDLLETKKIIDKIVSSFKLH